MDPGKIDDRILTETGRAQNKQTKNPDTESVSFPLPEY